LPFVLPCWELILPLHRFKFTKLGILIQKQTYSPTHPGSIIKKELKDRGLSQKDFAEAIGLRPSHISEVINGNRRITISFAESVEDWLGISAKLLLDMQLTYDLVCKSNNVDNAEEYIAISFLKELDEIIDVRALTKGQGKLKPIEKVDFIKKHYQIDSIDTLREDFSRLAINCFRRSAKTGLDERMIATWVVKAHSEVQDESPNGEFTLENSNELCRLICDVLHENVDTISRIKNILDDFGILFKVVSKLDHASIDGYSFFNKGVPCIVLTMRYNRIDNLAFTLMHELGHIILGHTTNDQQQISVDMRSFNDEDENRQEREADRFASEWLIPDKLWKLAPVAPMNPFVIQKKYFSWAEKRGLNKWIVLGRLSHETGIYKFKSDDSRHVIKEGGELMK